MLQTSKKLDILYKHLNGGKKMERYNIFNKKFIPSRESACARHRIKEHLILIRDRFQRGHVMTQEAQTPSPHNIS